MLIRERQILAWRGGIGTVGGDLAIPFEHKTAGYVLIRERQIPVLRGGIGTVGRDLTIPLQLYDHEIEALSRGCGKRPPARLPESYRHPPVPWAELRPRGYYDYELDHIERRRRRWE